MLRYDRGSKVPDEAHLRWFGRDTPAGVVKLPVLDDTSPTASSPPRVIREPAPVRRSLRAPVDNSPMLVKIVA